MTKATTTSPSAYTGARQPLKMMRPPQLLPDLTKSIGNTPVVNISKLLSPKTQEKNIELYAKCEFFNPLSSVKDRLAIAVIEDAEAKGLLQPGGTVIEATSGNTGIALAMVCAAKNYKFVAVMSESFSVERRKIMRALGAKVILTPAAGSGTGMVEKAKELADAHGWLFTRQFENEANPRYHANTTGPEILKAFAGYRLDYWVTGYGTGGTFQGAGKVLKQARPNLKVILAEPEDAPLVTSLMNDGVEQPRTEDGTPREGHKAFHPHTIQGWTPNFIPKICDEGIKMGLASRVCTVSGADAMTTAHQLARKTGVFTGISGGATTAVAMKVAEEAEEGAVLLAMLPDTMERYLSTPLFESIAAEMDEEEKAISLSTPSQILE